MDKIRKIAGKIASVYSEDIVLGEPFIDFAARFSSTIGTTVLMSGGDLDCSRYHILAAKPWLTFTGRERAMTVKAGGRSVSFEADPFDTLRLILNCCRPDVIQEGLTQERPLPVAAGLFGYLSYDLKDCLENLPRTSIDDLCLPHILFFAPSIIVVHDKKENNTKLFITIREVEGQSSLKTDLDYFQKTVSSQPVTKQHSQEKHTGLTSNLTKPEYIETIKKIREYIASGHVYQVNMSQRFETDFSQDPFGLFKDLYKINPAPFFAFINAGDHQVVSTSPERFIKQTGFDVETRPIKGTCPRGATLEQDRKLKLELVESKKNDAELSMIVDLLRNDLGKVCKGGSVRVAEHKKLEKYENVYHLVSTVKGVLDKDKDSVDLVKATFPGGSITGCPKIRSMEIIDELEPNRRHIYTGSIGYISFHDTMDLSVAIRTATVLNERIIFSVGGGIVFDSDPADEYEETLHKGKTLMEIFKGGEKGLKNTSFAWINGRIKPIDKAFIPASDPGFQYGYGFFETIRADSGKPKYLKEHIKRFYRAWEELFSQPVPDITWDEVIGQVLYENNLQEKTAAIKIVATKGDRDIPPYNNTLLVTVREYTHRLAGQNKSGLSLALYPKPRQTPLADHKTLNYLYYFLAGKWAKEQGADEALIMNPDKTVSETNTANIVLIKDKIAIRPLSTHVLPGIMENVVCGQLEKLGYEIKSKAIKPENLFSADQVIVTNSLMGAVPVINLDGNNMAEPTDLCRKINDVVL